MPQASSSGHKEYYCPRVISNGYKMDCACMLRNGWLWLNSIPSKTSSPDDQWYSRASVEGTGILKYVLEWISKPFGNMWHKVPKWWWPGYGEPAEIITQNTCRWVCIDFLFLTSFNRSNPIALRIHMLFLTQIHQYLTNPYCLCKGDNVFNHQMLFEGRVFIQRLLLISISAHRPKEKIQSRFDLRWCVPIRLCFVNCFWSLAVGLLPSVKSLLCCLNPVFHWLLWWYALIINTRSTTAGMGAMFI